MRASLEIRCYVFYLLCLSVLSVIMGISKGSPGSTPKSIVNKFQLIPEFLKIVQVNNLITLNVDKDVYLKFTDVRIKKPSIAMDGDTIPLNSQLCKLWDRTYAAPLTVNIEYRNGIRDQLNWKTDVIIGRMPVMLQSCLCNLYGKDEEELARLGECSRELGGLVTDEPDRVA
ncbi:hypothetical protein Dimus_004190 [Dionaea muscipula]